MRWCTWLFLAYAAPASARAVTPPGAQFALIIGVNKSVDPEVAPLRFADDDAAGYQDLFRLLGARTLILSRLDENTQRLHPQAAGEARDPTRSGLRTAVEVLAGEVAQARARGVPTTLYVIYAGHGNVQDGEGYIALEDGRLTGRELARGVIGRIGADRAHLIVDACYSYFLAYSRGPGGRRRPAPAFSEVLELTEDARTGLLLSTSSARESHEWEGFQAGIFSHEVRSALYGAADADGDGIVSYRELAAFIDRANAGIPNEKYRPDIFARPPRGTDALLDVRAAMARRIDVDGSLSAHYLLEDSNGVRLADFHNAAGAALRLVYPSGNGLHYLRRADDSAEYVLSETSDVMSLLTMTPVIPRVRERGAANDSFNHLFELAFDEQAVASYRPRTPDAFVFQGDGGHFPRPSLWAVSAFGMAAAAGAAGSAFAIDARSERQVPLGSSQAVVNAHNVRIARDDNWVLGLGVGAGVAAASGALLWFWPELKEHSVALQPGTGLGVAGTF